jgi:hypothetical protein
MSANGVVTLPLITLFGLSGGISGVSGAVVLPILSIQGVAASNGGGLVLSSLLISGTSNTQNLSCSGGMVLPLFSFAGTVGAQGGFVLPGFNLSGSGHCVGLAQGGFTLGRVLVLGTATPGQNGVGSLVLPVFSLSGTTHHVPHGHGSLTIPVFTICSTGFALAGVVPEIPYRTVVVNPRYAAVSEYVEFNFDSFCEFPAGVFLAAGPTGLFQLYSDTGLDNGNLISAELEFGTTDFGEQTKKNCTDGFINYRGDGLAEINALADELEDPDIYQTKEIADSRLRNYKFKMSKFRNGKNWKFSVKNVAGSNLDINEVAFFYDVLSRRI